MFVLELCFSEFRWIVLLYNTIVIISFHTFRKHARVSLESSGENNLKSNLTAADARCVESKGFFHVFETARGQRSIKVHPRKNQRIPLLVYVIPSLHVLWSRRTRACTSREGTIHVLRINNNVKVFNNMHVLMLNKRRDTGNETL